MTVASPSEHRTIPSGKAAVAVVGSANLDIVLSTRRLPRPGETVLGDTVSDFPGGKGLNQALAAARLAPTAFIGAVGTDAAGARLEATMTAAGIDTGSVRHVVEASGVAYISVAHDGENSIIVVPGANATVSAEHVESALAQASPDVVVTQLETPVD